MIPYQNFCEHRYEEHCGLVRHVLKSIMMHVAIKQNKTTLSNVATRASSFLRVRRNFAWISSNFPEKQTWRPFFGDHTKHKEDGDLQQRFSCVFFHHTIRTKVSNHLCLNVPGFARIFYKSNFGDALSPAAPLPPPTVVSNFLIGNWFHATLRLLSPEVLFEDLKIKLRNVMWTPFSKTVKAFSDRSN